MDATKIAPKISSETDLTLAQAKKEYKELLALQADAPEYGWVQWIETKINYRMEFLRKVITDFYIEESKNGK